MIGMRSGTSNCGRLLCWLRRTCVCRSEFPHNRGIGVRLVGAEGSSLDASREQIPQRSVALRDSFLYRLDRLGDALPGSVRSRPGPAITSTQSYVQHLTRGAEASDIDPRPLELVIAARH